MGTFRTARRLCRRARSRSVAENLESRVLPAASLFARGMVDVAMADQQDSAALDVNQSVAFGKHQASSFNVIPSTFVQVSAGLVDYGYLEAFSRAELNLDPTETKTGEASLEIGAVDSVVVVPVNPAHSGLTATVDVTLHVDVVSGLFGTIGVGSSAAQSFEVRTDIGSGGGTMRGARTSVNGGAPTSSGFASLIDDGTYTHVFETTINLGRGQSNNWSMSVSTQNAGSGLGRFGQANGRLSASVAWGGISNIRLPDGTVLGRSDLRSTSESGRDYIGTGPPPPPDDAVRWTGAVSTSFEEDGNWDPNQRPRADDTAVFDETSAYTVDVGSHTVERVVVQGGAAGNLTLRNANLVAGSLSETAAGVEVASGRLSFAGLNRLTTNHAAIGTVGTGTVKVGRDVDFNVNGRLSVGAGGLGFLDVEDEGEVTVSELRIGADPAGLGVGTVNVRGTSLTSLKAGNTVIGFSSAGTLNVEDGALVEFDGRLQLGGAGESAPGLVFVDGHDLDVNELLIATLDGHELDIRDGRMDVLRGGQAAFQNTSVGSTSDTLTRGRLTVDGTNSSTGTASHLSVLGTLSAAGRVAATNGGTINTSLDVTVGNRGDGDAVAALIIEGSGSTVETNSGVYVGTDNRVGHIRINDGGSLRSQDPITIGTGGALQATFGTIAVGSEESPGLLTNRGRIEINGGPDEFLVDLVRTNWVNRDDSVVVIDGGFVLVGDISLRDNSILRLENGGAAVAESLRLFEGDSTATISGAGDDGPSRINVTDVRLGESTSLTVSAGAIGWASDQLYMEPDSVVNVGPSGHLVLGADAAEPIPGILDVRTGGTLYAYGTINAQGEGGYVNNGGTVNVGNSPGELVINGDYVQTEEGILIIEIGGAEAGVNYDQLIVNGDVTLDGEVRIEFVNGYVPGPEETFSFVVSESREGEFDRVTVTGLPAGMDVELSAAGGTMTLDVTGESDPALACEGQRRGTRLQGSSLFVVGGGGHDLLSVRLTNAELEVQRNTHTKVFAAERVSSIVMCGGRRRDTLIVSPNISLPTILDGGDGPDVIYGGGGPDIVFGGRGHDVIRGQSGDDLLFGSGHNDRIYGGDGDDSIQAGSGQDIAFGEGGADTLSGSRGPDRLDGGSGADILRGGDGIDRLWGGSGRDLLEGGRDSDSLWGGGADDLIVSGTITMNNARLTVVLAEWTSDRSYDERIANLRGISPEADRLNGRHFLSTAAPRSVFAEDQHDFLSGSAGRDWFFATAQDQLIGLTSREVLDLL